MLRSLVSALYKIHFKGRDRYTSLKFQLYSKRASLFILNQSSYIFFSSSYKINLRTAGNELRKTFLLSVGFTGKLCSKKVLES
jgi:NADH:ubiquinone oxidoreductase subunit 4 (subunit M)